MEPTATSPNEGGDSSPELGPVGPTAVAWGYPAFAKEFPQHAELDALVEAFTRGDYRTIRMRVPRLTADPAVPTAVREAAQKLRARIEPDGTAKWFFLFTALLLAFLTIWWVSHDGPDPRARPASSPSR